MNASEIVKAMSGRRCGSVNDGSLKDAIRMKLEQLANTANRPMTRSDALRIADHVLRACGSTNLYENEVAIALEAGAAGEFGNEDRRIIPTNVTYWITAYSVCGDRKAAMERSSLSAAIAKKRADSVVDEELRRDWEENGLRRIWDEFTECKRTGADWSPLPGRAAAAYNRLKERGLMPRPNSDTEARARLDAIAAVRRKNCSVRSYSRASEEEIFASSSYDIEFRSALVRYYFEALWKAGRNLEWKVSNDLPL